MNELKAFNVDIYNLSLGTHQFDFKVDKSFFDSFEYSIVQSGELDVKLDLDNRETFLVLDFTIKGSIDLTCDRSLEEFEHVLDLKEQLILKYGSEEIQGDDEIEIIEPGTIRINVADFIYEYITIAVPMKKIHPKYLEESEEDEVIYYTSDEDESEEKDTSGSVWDQLKKLKK
jgi:uncharacterized metal-binding protein YceD (DUF177 family)